MSALTEPKDLSDRERNAGLSLVLIAALLVAFFAAWPLISEPGFLNTRGGGDSPFLLQRLQQLEIALRDGHFPARWMRDANYGFGYPFFNYYAPLSIYIAALFRFLGFSLVRSVEGAQLLGFLLAALGIFLLARRWYRDEWAALLASVAYTVAPFHLVNVYVRGDSLAEFWAMAWYPWVILAADRLLVADDKGFPYGRVAALALVYAALILSHNISALIFTPFLFLFILLRWLLWRRSMGDPVPPIFSGQRLRLLLPMLAAGLLGLALAAWFFLPALVEQRFAQLGPVTEGYFSFTNHFRSLNLVQSSAVFDFDVSGGNAFRMGLVQAAAALLGSGALILFSFRTKAVALAPALFILLTLALATFMVTPLSRMVWEVIPLLPFTQFPWRFLSVQAFAASLAIGALALLPYCRVVTIGTAVILITSSFAGLQTDHLLLNDDDITAESLAAYEWYTGNIGSTVSAEYLPESVQPRFFTSAWLNEGQRANVRALEGDLVSAVQTEHLTTRQNWHMQTGDDGATIIMPTMAWPGWRAVVDGLPVELRPAPGSGQFMLSLPPGEHELTLTLADTAVRRVAELLSLGALLLTVFLVVKARHPLRFERTSLAALISLAAFFLLFRFWPQQALSAGTLTWDFAQMAYLHHDESGIPFSSGTTLLRYEYDRESAAAGQPVTLTLHFSEANGDVVTVALGTPALTWPVFSPQAPPIVAQSEVLDSESLTISLPIPSNAPSGMVIPRVTLHAGRPMMPSGRLRGDLFLRPLHISNAERPAAGGAPLDVEAVDVQLRDSEALDVQLAWMTQEPLSHNYNASLLLVDEMGGWLAQLDTQPGYGFLPSSEWMPGVSINDWYVLELPEELPQESPLALVARLYEVDSGTVVLTRRLGEVLLRGDSLIFEDNQPSFTLPDKLTPLVAQFDDRIRLHGYDLERDANDQWQLTFYWQAAEVSPEEAVRFIHVFDPRSEEIVYQIDGYPRNNGYPVSQWSAGEVVSDMVTLSLDLAPPGKYQIAVGFYRQGDENGQRLTAVDPGSGEPFADGRVLLPEMIER